MASVHPLPKIVQRLDRKIEHRDTNIGSDPQRLTCATRDTPSGRPAQDRIDRIAQCLAQDDGAIASV